MNDSILTKEPNPFVIETHKVTKGQLMGLMCWSSPPTVKIAGNTGTLEGMQREDGSGRSFNLQVRIGAHTRYFHVRTYD